VFFFQAEDGIRDATVTEFRRVLFRSDLKPLRTTNSLDESRVISDPLKQFNKWLLESAGRRAILPETMMLATATRSGRPSVRTLLLREFDDSGFVFYTDYSGRKGRELAENPQAALVFYWPRTGRQV